MVTIKYYQSHSDSLKENVLIRAFGFSKRIFKSFNLETSYEWPQEYEEVLSSWWATDSCCEDALLRLQYWAPYPSSSSWRVDLSQHITVLISSYFPRHFLFYISLLIIHISFKVKKYFLSKLKILFPKALLRFTYYHFLMSVKHAYVLVWLFRYQLSLKHSRVRWHRNTQISND